ncbi:MAG: toll/interleukin-1 receptor domain-containing protein [Actinomycetota bacterium]
MADRRAVFISYTHVDNEPFGGDQVRWVSHFHDQLLVRVRQWLGQDVHIWRDERDLRGNVELEAGILEQLRDVAAMVPVCSPAYLASGWCKRELEAFTSADGSRSPVGRLFKVQKLPVDPEREPPSLRRVRGYQFFREIDDTGAVREFLLDPEQRWRFYAEVDDLARDISEVVREQLQVGPAPSAARVVFLGTPSSTIRDSHDVLRRELLRRAYGVVGSVDQVGTLDDVTSSVRAHLKEAVLAVHPLGARYGARPEGSERSVQDAEIRLAAEAASRTGLEQIVWVPLDDESLDPMQEDLLDEVARAEGVFEHTQLLRSTVAELNSVVLGMLSSPAAGTAGPSASARPTVYIVAEGEDRELLTELSATLLARDVLVLPPPEPGSAEEVRRIHRDALVLCDAVVILHRDQSPNWLQSKLMDVLRAPAWGRAAPIEFVHVVTVDASAADLDRRVGIERVHEVSSDRVSEIAGPIVDSLAGGVT